MSTYGYDSRRRRRARRVDYWARVRRQFVRWVRVLLITALLGVAVFAVVYDHLARPESSVQFVEDPPTTYVTTTLQPAPRVADTGRNAPHRHP